MRSHNIVQNTVGNGDIPENDKANLSIFSDGDKINNVRGDMIGEKSNYEPGKIDIDEGDQNPTCSPFDVLPIMLL